MTFKNPGDITALSDEALGQAINDALDALRPMLSAEDDALTDEQVAEAETLTDFITAARGAQTEREGAAAERAATLAAARSLVTEPEPEPEPEAPEPEPEPEAAAETETPEVQDDSEAGDPPAEEGTPPEDGPKDGDEFVDQAAPTEEVAQTPAEQPELITASKKETIVKRPASTVPPAAPTDQVEDAPKVTFLAAPDVKGYAASQELPDLREVGQAAVARAAGFANVRTPGRFDRFPFAVIQRPESDFDLSDKADPATEQEVITRASSEGRLTDGNLVAAGGWAAPSETLYDLCQITTDAGLVDVPEITVRRGGVRYTKGPDFTALYDDLSALGWIQTEAQAEAGTAKTCEEITVPDFEEVRADAVGLCVRAPILTRHAYPELVEAFMREFLVAYQHKVSKETIDRMLSLTGDAQTVADVWGTATSVLHAVELVALGYRQQHRMAFGATLEGIAPFWLRAALRADLANRTGVDTLTVSDAQIDAHFAARGIRLQFVYNWQPLTIAAGTGTGPGGVGTGFGVATDYPATVSLLLYPAGTFVRGHGDIMSLETVYDSTLLSTNMYTALFAEQDLLVVNTCNDARHVTVPLSVTGRTGAADLSHVFGTAPAP